MAEDVARAFLASLDAALTAGDAEAVAALLLPDGHWRDLLAFAWDLTSTSGREAIAARLRDRLPVTRPRNLHLAADRTPPRRVMRAGQKVVEAFFRFDTATGPAEGIVRLRPDADGQWRAWILLTALDGLHGHGTEAAKPDYARDFGGENWLDKRNRARAYADHEPAVVVVGCGQAGLGIAARLGQFGVDTLVIDREARIGDNWRNRYHALTLHNEVHVNHLPYMPFPPTWPVFIPKDRLASWFEAYAEAMELNVWTGTELTGGRFDGDTWTLDLKRADGSTRQMRPRHVVFATGVSAIPIRPDLPGLSDFAGTVLHSGSYTDSAVWKGRRAQIVGTGNSAHDVAQDLHAGGAAVTMIQRSPTYIVSLQEAQRVYTLYTEGLPTADCDLLATAMPFPVLQDAYRMATKISREIDKPLLDKLEAAGFRLDEDPDSMGFQMLYLQRGGGYYFNVGCSDLIAAGEIGLLHYDSIDRFVPEGARLKDGSIVPADLIVLATGYKNQQDTARAFLGDAVAERIGPVWGFDDGGELRNMWRPTAQQGLWFTAGSLAQCRIYSKYLALQIKAREAGLMPGA